MGSVLVESSVCMFNWVIGKCEERWRRREEKRRGTWMSSEVVSGKGDSNINGRDMTETVHQTANQLEFTMLAMLYSNKVSR